MRLLLGLVVMTLTFQSGLSQAIDNTASFRMIEGDKYVRLHYENDFFTGHDLYYTQGINLEFVNPTYGKFILSKLLITPSSAVSNYGIALEHNGYTPSSITHDNILYGDRPFAADLLVKLFSFSSETNRRLRVTSSISIGIIGSVASGYWMQKTIHHWLNGTVPHGWQNQIGNDAVINYEAGVEKNLLHAGNCFVLNGQVSARVGTLSDKASAGFVLMTGKLNHGITSAFCGNNSSVRDNFNIHLYAQPLFNLVAYDATLQGGAFDRHSPYTLSSHDVQHVTAQINYGLVFSYRSINIDYFKAAISKEFNSASNHRWGGIRLGVRL